MQETMQLQPAPIMATLKMKQGRIYFPQWIRELIGFSNEQSYEVWLTNDEGVIILKRAI